jgi:hypothetical protein
MTHAEMRAQLGIKRVNYVSRDTVVIEFACGARPATLLERMMIKLLDEVYADA